MAEASSSSSRPPPSSSASGGKPDRLFVGNLSPTVDEYTLIQVFSKYGKITKLDFMFHKSGVLKGKPRGYAFIEFSNKDVSGLDVASCVPFHCPTPSRCSKCEHC